MYLQCKYITSGLDKKLLAHCPADVVAGEGSVVVGAVDGGEVADVELVNEGEVHLGISDIGVALEFAGVFHGHRCLLAWFHGSCHLYAQAVVRHLKVGSVLVHKCGIRLSEHSLKGDLHVSLKEAGVELSHLLSEYQHCQSVGNNGRHYQADHSRHHERVVQKVFSYSGGSRTVETYCSYVRRVVRNEEISVYGRQDT